MLLAASTLSSCTSGRPGTQYHYYSVYSDNELGLTRSVRRSAPRAGRAYGLTAITFLPSYELVESGGRCRAKEVHVELALMITLPKWRAGKPVSTRVTRRFGRFERYVKQHEMHHVGIAKSYARQAERKISSMASSRGCNALRGEMAAYMTRMKRQHLQQHKLYDMREVKRLKALLL